MKLLIGLCQFVFAFFALFGGAYLFGVYYVIGFLLLAFDENTWIGRTLDNLTERNEILQISLGWLIIIFGIGLPLLLVILV